MKRASLLFVLLSFLIVLSSCNIFNSNTPGGQAKVTTRVNIVDPYGNKLIVSGNINSYPIKADKDGAYIEAKINSVEKYSFDKSESILNVMEVQCYPIKSDKDGAYIEAKINSVEKYSFDKSESILNVMEVQSVDFDGKSVNITLGKKNVRDVALCRTADGYLMFYAYGYGDTPNFQIWLKDRLAGTSIVDLNKDQVLLAGGWIAGVGKGRGIIGLNRNPNEIYAKLQIPASSAPRIERVEIISVK